MPTPRRNLHDEEIHFAPAGKGAAVLTDYASKNDPFARVGRESVTVQITSVTRASDASFNVRWTE